MNIVTLGRLTPLEILLYEGRIGSLLYQCRLSETAQHYV